MTLREQIGAEIRRIREAKKWTRTQAAEAADMDVNAYRKYEEGSLNITADTLERLCRALGANINVTLKNKKPA